MFWTPPGVEKENPSSVPGNALPLYYSNVHFGDQQEGGHVPQCSHQQDAQQRYFLHNFSNFGII
jgi:hypothetical protein